MWCKWIWNWKDFLWEAVSLGCCDSSPSPFLLHPWCLKGHFYGHSIICDYCRMTIFLWFVWFQHLDKKDRPYVYKTLALNWLFRAHSLWKGNLLSLDTRRALVLSQMMWQTLMTRHLWVMDREWSWGEMGSWEEGREGELRLVCKIEKRKIVF